MAGNVISLNFNLDIIFSEMHSLITLVSMVLQSIPANIHYRIILFALFRFGFFKYFYSHEFRKHLSCVLLNLFGIFLADKWYFINYMLNNKYLLNNLAKYLLNKQFSGFLTNELFQKKILVFTNSYNIVYLKLFCSLGFLHGVFVIFF